MLRGCAGSPNWCARWIAAWNTNTQHSIADHPEPGFDPFGNVALSDDGRFIVTGGLKTIQRWDGETLNPIGEPMRGLQWENDAVAFTHDGRYIVSSDKASLRFWDTMTGNSVGEPLDAPTTRSISEIAVGPEDRWISTDDYFLWPGPASWCDMLCAKVTTNMSHKQWNNWVSPTSPT